MRGVRGDKSPGAGSLVMGRPLPILSLSEYKPEDALGPYTVLMWRGQWAAKSEEAGHGQRETWKLVRLHSRRQSWPDDPSSGAEVGRFNNSSHHTF